MKLLPIRITTTTVRKKATVVVEGRLTAAEVPSLREACQAVGGRVRLDLSGLQMADEAGTRELRSLSEEGAELHGPSLFIRQLLDGRSS